MPYIRQAVEKEGNTGSSNSRSQRNRPASRQRREQKKIAKQQIPNLKEETKQPTARLSKRGGVISSQVATGTASVNVCGGGGHAAAVVTKAPAVDEIGKTTVKAAPMKDKRYEGRGAGGQAAASVASAQKTRPAVV